jgi:hypothetical protein
MASTQPTRKDIAEFFRLSLLAGVCDLPEVVRWADAVITAESSPPFAFFDLSTCESQPVNAACGLLTEVPGERTPDLAVHMLLARCYCRFQSGILPVTETLLRLYRMARAEAFPDPIYFELVTQEDAYALARDGIYCSIPEVEKSFTDYLSRFQPFGSLSAGI